MSSPPRTSEVVSHANSRIVGKFFMPHGGDGDVQERGKSFTQQSEDMNKNVSSIQISSKARRVKKNESVNK